MGRIIDGRRRVVRRRQRLRRAGAAERTRPGPAGGPAAVRLQGRYGRPHPGEGELVLVTDDEHRAAAIKDLIESKAIRRGLSLKIFDWGKVEPSGGSKVRQQIRLRRGLPEDLAKKLKLIRDGISEDQVADPG